VRNNFFFGDFLSQRVCLATSEEFKGTDFCLPPAVEYAKYSEKDSVFKTCVRSLEFSDSILTVGILPESMEEDNTFTLINELNRSVYMDNFFTDPG
jgi:hypothetical protein